MSLPYLVSLTSLCLAHQLYIHKAVSMQIPCQPLISSGHMNKGDQRSKNGQGHRRQAEGFKDVSGHMQLLAITRSQVWKQPEALPHANCFSTHPATASPPVLQPAAQVPFDSSLLLKLLSYLLLFCRVTSMLLLFHLYLTVTLLEHLSLPHQCQFHRHLPLVSPRQFLS